MREYLARFLEGLGFFEQEKGYTAGGVPEAPAVALQVRAEYCKGRLHFLYTRECGQTVVASEAGVRLAVLPSGRDLRDYEWV